MSKKEFDRLEVLLGVRSGRLRVADACALLFRKEFGRAGPGFPRVGGRIEANHISQGVWKGGLLCDLAHTDEY